MEQVNPNLRRDNQARTMPVRVAARLRMRDRGRDEVPLKSLTVSIFLTGRAGTARRGAAVPAAKVASNAVSLREVARARAGLGRNKTKKSRVFHPRAHIPNPMKVTA